MIITTDKLIAILSAGGSLVLNASQFTLAQLKALATEAQAYQSFITLKNVEGITPEHLQEIARIAPGNIVFDLVT